MLGFDFHRQRYQNKGKIMSIQIKKQNNNIFVKAFGKLSEWTLFERIWLLTFTVINISLFFVWQDTILGLISSLSGMLCVVLVAKGKISNYAFGVIQTTTYGYIAYTYGLYGESMLNLLFYFPVQFVGIYMWRKNKVNKENSVQGEDVAVQFLTKKTALIVSIVCVLSIILYALFLKFIGGTSVGLDSATNVLSIAAQLLMLKRYAEQWIMWIVINLLSIIMWAVTLIAQGGNDWSMVVMWTAFLFNSIYGYINWKKMGKVQPIKETEQKVVEL